ncbi:MAG: SpoVG family protein [candidate division Zixibacteria bacterium]|nr:SpoVG family protein [candidate division Zixibacteria bacterium]MCI0594945.1 SpoVG family protein [candidate division Zixibacteria bacterium]
MEITDIRIIVKDEQKLKGFANVTFDKAFVVRGMKIISGLAGFFVSMPSRRRSDGTYQDIAHPITPAMRKQLEEAVLKAYQSALHNQKHHSEGNLAFPP